MEKTKTVLIKTPSLEDVGKKVVVINDTKDLKAKGCVGVITKSDDKYSSKIPVQLEENTLVHTFYCVDIELMEPKEELEFIHEEGVEDVYDYGGYEHRSVERQLEVIEKNIKHLEKYKSKLEKAKNGDKSMMIVYPYDTNFPVVVGINDVVSTKYGKEGLIIKLDHEGDHVTLKYLDGTEETLGSHRIA